MTDSVVYRMGQVPQILRAPPLTDGHLSIRVAAHALKGIQKEAVVSQGEGDKAWRLLCEEGPYLNGTNLAPPPLAYFSAGMVAHNASIILDASTLAGMHLDDLELIKDAFYTMDGSAIRGTMVGGALPVELTIRARSGSELGFRELAISAIGRSLGEYLMRTPLTGTFSITRNGIGISTGKVAPSKTPTPECAPNLFKAIKPDSHESYPADIICKLQSAAQVSDRTHGAGASLKESQKRMLHLRAKLILQEDGLKRIEVQLLKPIGSIFQFLSDNSACFGGGRAAHRVDWPIFQLELRSAL